MNLPYLNSSGSRCQKSVPPRVHRQEVGAVWRTHVRQRTEAGPEMGSLEVGVISAHPLHGHLYCRDMERIPKVRWEGIHTSEPWGELVPKEIQLTRKKCTTFLMSRELLFLTPPVEFTLQISGFSTQTSKHQSWLLWTWPPHSLPFTSLSSCQADLDKVLSSNTDLLVTDSLVPKEHPERPLLTAWFTLLPLSTLSRWTPVPFLCLPSHHSSCKYHLGELPESQNILHVPGSSPAYTSPNPPLMRSLSTLGLTNKEALLHIIFVSLALTAHISFMVSWWGGRQQHKRGKCNLFLRLAFQARILNFTIFFILFIKGVFLIFFSSFTPSLILESGQSHSWPEIPPQIITHSLSLYLYLSIYILMPYSRSAYFPPVALAYDLFVNIVQSPRCVLLFATPWTAAHQASLSLTISQSLPKFMPIVIGDAIQPSHPLSPSSPSASSPSQHKGLFQWAGFLHQVAKILELQHHSFQWVFRVFSSNTVWKHQFFRALPSLWSSFQNHTWPLERP